MAGPDGLLERDREILFIEGAIDSAMSGSGRAAMVCGEAGIGKSALLDAAAREAARRDLLVLRSRGRELDVPHPFAVVLGLLERPLAQLGEDDRARVFRGAAEPAARLFEAQAAPSAPLSSFTIHHALYWTVLNLAGERPVVVVVDDLHWADASSLGFLTHLLDRLDDAPIAMIGALRPGESAEPETLDHMLAHASAGVIEPPPLSQAAVAKLVRTRLPRASPGFAEACLKSTGGNPFLVGEVIAAAGGGEDEARASTPTERLGRLTLARLTALGAGAVALAQAVAVLGGDVPLALAAQLAGLDSQTAMGLADALASTRLLISGERADFAHPLLRAAVYDRIPPARRSAAHGTAAELTAAVGASPSTVAAHLLRAPRCGSRSTVETLRQAAREASADAAPASAARFLRRAVEEPPDPADRAAVLAELGIAEARAGEGGLARLESAVPLAAPGAPRAEILLQLGQLLYIGGRPLDAARALEQGLAEAEGSGEDSLSAALESAWLTVARLNAALRPRAVERIARLLEAPPLGPSLGERALLAQLAGQLVFDAHRREEALRLARHALGDGDLIALETSDGLAWIVAAGALGWSDDFEGYDRAHRDAHQDAVRRASVTGFALASYMRSFSSYYAGRLKEAVADAQQAVDARHHGWSQFLGAARAQLAWALVDLGEFEAARAHLDAAKAAPGFSQSSEAPLVLESEAKLHLATGDPQAALEAAMTAGEIMRAVKIRNPSCMAWRTRAATAAAQLGRTQEARELAGEDLELARGFGAPRPIGLALTGLAAASPAADRAAILEEAVIVLAASPARLELARAQILLGGALRRAGHRVSARRVLAEGLELARECGAKLIEDRAVEELLAAGARPAQRPARGVDSLTPAEARVARLAADGMSNREIAQELFVSLRTTETHLTHVYMKLGGITRRDLPAILSSA